MMESGKRELDSGEVNGEKESPATYKPLPEDYVDAETEDKGVIKMSKVNGEGEVDEAQERMLNSNKGAEVKFISENGDTKIDIPVVKQTLAGMGKEELMKFAKDPFWVRLRWFMFIMFWVLWAAMLAGAIAIIVMAPKCPAPPCKKWWEESPIVRLEASDAPNGTLKELQSVIENLKSKHVRAIELSPIMKTSSSGHVIDFKDVQQQLGSKDDLKNLISAAKKENQRVILELDPSHTSIEHSWFIQSVQKVDPYTNYYVWVNCKPGSPPNNWASLAGGSAWEYNAERKQCYLHQFNSTQPDLNFRNATVVKEISDVLLHWMNLGVSGFRLANTQYLLEDANFENETTSTAAEGEKQVYQPRDPHTKTRDLDENANVLREWRRVVHNYTHGEGLFTLWGNTGASTLVVYNENSTIDLPQCSQFLHTAESNITAVEINKGVSQCLAISNSSSGWPGWDLNGEGPSLRQRTSPNISDSLILMMMLLPGTPILRQNDTLSAPFAILSKIRLDSAAFLHGETKTDVINGTVFVYTRFKSGYPAYLVAYQSGTERAVIDLTQLSIVPEKVSIVAYSPNYIEKDIAIKSKPPSNSVPISPKSTLVVTFAPDIKDNK